MNTASPRASENASTVPAYDDMMQVVLDALRAKDGQATNAEITSYVAQTLELPAEVVQQLHKPGRNLTRLEYNLSEDLLSKLRQFSEVGNFGAGGKH